MKAGIDELFLLVELLAGVFLKFGKLTLGQLRELMPSLKTVTDNLQTVSEDIVEVGKAAREQVHNVEEMIGETGRTLQDQLERVDRMSRDVSERVNETVDVVQDSIIRPVREVGALARGDCRCGCGS